jgi:hypothetical protein
LFFLIAERRTAAGRTPLFSSHVFPRQKKRRRRRRRRSVFGEDFRFNNESFERRHEEDLFYEHEQKRYVSQHEHGVTSKQT